ncbi:hypothetical protein RJ640_012534 [Escallonia rubra]|uniref:BED-type domain-containing protein n=1 Tax=Escallonia rubra TaxID=112253 RepID=A0AA88S2P3_9ASTE|nr:hypothetical protein RJ640_012534 [Escallonia rubra]
MILTNPYEELDLVAKGQGVEAVQKNWGQMGEVVQKVKGQWAEVVRKRKHEHELTQEPRKYGYLKGQNQNHLVGMHESKGGSKQMNPRQRILKAHDRVLTQPTFPVPQLSAEAEKAIILLANTSIAILARLVICLKILNARKGYPNCRLSQQEHSCSTLMDESNSTTFGSVVSPKKGNRSGMGKGKRKKTYATSSHVWDHYDKVKNDEGLVIEAVCKYCSRVFVTCNDKGSFGTSTLMRHIYNSC